MLPRHVQDKHVHMAGNNNAAMGWHCTHALWPPIISQHSCCAAFLGAKHSDDNIQPAMRVRQ